MKAKYIFIITLLSTIIGLSDVFSQNNITNADYKQSKNLIDRYNKLRTLDNLPSTEHDTILDNVSKLLLTNKTYKNSAGTYYEDSVRLLLYNNGIIDYQYEIQEISDKDTSAVFKKFLLADKSKFIRMGYYKYADRHILLKTKSYLKHDHTTALTWSDPISPLNPKSEVKFYIDSIVCHFKFLIPDQYYYQFYKLIPLSSEKGGECKKKVQMSPGVSKFGEYDFTTIAVGEEAYMFMIILNENNERVAVVK